MTFPIFREMKENTKYITHFKNKKRCWRTNGKFSFVIFFTFLTLEMRKTYFHFILKIREDCQWILNLDFVILFSLLFLLLFRIFVFLAGYYETLYEYVTEKRQTLLYSAARLSIRILPHALLCHCQSHIVTKWTIKFLN